MRKVVPRIAAVVVRVPWEPPRVLHKRLAVAAEYFVRVGVVQVISREVGVFRHEVLILLQRVSPVPALGVVVIQSDSDFCDYFFFD